MALPQGETGLIFSEMLSLALIQGGTPVARRSTPPPNPADWSPKKTYGALKNQLASLESLRGRNFREAEHDYTGWKNLTLNIFTHGFGEGSNNVGQFHGAKWTGQHYFNMSDRQMQVNYDQRIEAFAATLKSSLSELELMGALDETAPSPEVVIGGVVVTTGTSERSAPTKGVALRADSRNIFLVHGHNDGVRESVARFLEKLDLHPIILHEQPNKGRTIIEKFEANADVGFAVVLLTPDDVGGLASDGKLAPRARQNVILELGYFIGKLGRARVCVLHAKELEVPSDIHGVLYVPYDDGGGGWRLKLGYEIKAAGIEIDMNKV